MASAAIAPRRLVADGGMNRERLIAMDDRFAEYIARMSCVRTGLVLESDGAGTKSHVSHGPPERDALNVACRSCTALARCQR